MKVIFARIISVIFHPVFMPMYALIFIFRQSTYFYYVTPPNVRMGLFVITLLNTLLLPMLITYFLYYRGWIKSLEMEKREERLVPFIINLFFLLLASYMIYRNGLPRIFYLLMLAGAASVFITILINLKWKISIHMVGAGCIVGIFFGLSTFLLVDFRMQIAIGFLISGLIGTARMQSGSHTIWQIIAGFFVGFCSEYIVLSF